jgi:hypothetical protein
MNTNLLLIPASLGLFLVSCGGPQKPVTQDSQKPEVVTVKSPDFNEDSAYTYVAAQVAFGPRIPNSKAHQKCADYLVSRLKSYTSHVIDQKAVVRSFDDKNLNIRNIIGSFNPENTTRIMLCSHWDSRPFADHDPDPKNYNTPIDGANDGASGVGILLEVARVLAANNPGIGVDIIFFDAEDYGQPQDKEPQKEDTWCLGSQYWAKNPHIPEYKANFGILLDMVGAANAEFPKEAYSLQYGPDIVSKVWSTGQRIGFSSYFPDENGGYVTDDHVYVNQLRNFPVVDIIPQDHSKGGAFFEHWHTVGDKIGVIDRNTLNAVGQTLLQVIFEMHSPPAS